MIETDISLGDLKTRFPDQETAISYMESKRWPTGVCCPGCNMNDKIYRKGGTYYRCGYCRKVFTVKTGTIMERSRIPLNIWIYGQYLFLTIGGLTSISLGLRLDISQAASWRMLGIFKKAHNPNGWKLWDTIKGDN